ncbi:MAG: hypothetical protein WC670_04080 [Pseudolabrys sp.]|jgi:hypothetical protein
MAGMLLYSVVYWIKYGRAVIPGVEGYWVAHTRHWWCREACLSIRQYDRAIAKLAKWGLVEKRQWWFGQRNILYVRPSGTVEDFLIAAKTWAAAHELAAAKFDFAPPKLAENGNPSLPDAEISNVFSETGEPSPPSSEISNNIINSHNSFGIKKNNIPTNPLPASPSCSNTASHKEKVSGGGKKGKKSNSAHPVKLEYSNAAYHIAPVFTLQQLLNIWKAAVGKYHAHALAAGKFELPSGPEDFGSLAEINETLTGMYGPNGDENLQQNADDIIAFAIEHWSELGTDSWGKTKPYPSIAFLSETLGTAVTIWDKAGRPTMPAALKAACGPSASVLSDVGAP